MKVGIVGSGAVGLYYGARLQLSGQEVHFLLRSDLEAARKDGITIKAGDGVHLVKPVRAAGDPSEIGVCDLVIVSLKTTANGEAPRLTRPLVGPGTCVLTLQNGLGNDDLLARLYPENRILAGLCFVCLNRVAPAVVEGFIPGKVAIGDRGGPLSETAREVGAAFQAAGVKIDLYDDLLLAQWKKLVWNVPFNGLAIAGGGITTDLVLADEKLRALVRELMEEIVAGAAALGLKIERSFIDRQIDLTYPMGPYKPSSLIDYLAGRPVEVEAIWGEPLRRAQAAGVAMPRLAALYRELKERCVAAGC